MSEKRGLFLFSLAFLLGMFLLVIPAAFTILGKPRLPVANAQQGCVELTSETEIPERILIDFDSLSDGTLIGTSYLPSFGVTFDDSRITHAIISGKAPGEAKSPPNVALNEPVPPGGSSGVSMRIFFDAPKTHVGMYMGNGGDGRITALLTAYDANGSAICELPVGPVPQVHEQFIGLEDPEGRIFSVSLDYGQSEQLESIDDLFFAPRRGLASTRTPLPTWTPIPTLLPTAGPAPTATPLVAAMPYFKAKDILLPAFIGDLSIHGIEITQGIQCFDTSKGLAGCPNNSLPVVAKKDTAARIYLKGDALLGNLSNVPVRLHLFAANVEYIANASGKATTLLDQSKHDSADVYFNVNFTNNVVVDFYAEVDPDNVIAETNEGNNRYPPAGFISLTFQRRDALKIVGTRLHYHPPAYGGSQYAGGWAVNGGAADWFEQMLPIRNNGVNYSLRSGYLDWTSNLSSDTNQHNLIKTLNAYWILENAFAWWFTGDFTGANHVYGWAPNDGYTGGHADMPVYPHAGGLGVVGIGTDRPGTTTDNPGGGALIFGHELVHDYNVYHTDTPDACGSNDGNSDFAYSSSNIQEFGFNPYTGKIYNPSNTHDLMSYCPSGGSKEGWISPFTWNKMFNYLSPAFSAYNPQAAQGTAKVYQSTAAEQSLVVNATIFNPFYEPPSLGELGDLYKIDTGVAYLLPEGDYAVELRDGDGGVLGSYFFAANFESEYDAHNGAPHNPNEPPPFPPDPTSQVDVSFIVPWTDGTVSVALTYKGEVLDERFLSPNPPQVFITDPAGQETWLSGSTHTVSWQGIDLDGDPLIYSVFYSHDGGSNWILLQSELAVSSYDVEANSLAGGSDVRFRVVATDGIHTAFDETDQAITVSNQPPVAIITNPPGNKIAVPGSLIVFQGIATDFEDGGLPDSGMVWSSDLQGGLGLGPSVPINNLVPGKHTITLAATDSYGVTTEATVSILIAYPQYIPHLIR